MSDQVHIKGLVSLEDNLKSIYTSVKLLDRAPDCFQYISGVILSTLYQKTLSAMPFLEVVKEGGVIPGIEVYKGTDDLVGTIGETTTQGLDGLVQHCQRYYNVGAQFVDWKAVLKLGTIEPSLLSIMCNRAGVALEAKVVLIVGSILAAITTTPTVHDDLLQRALDDIAVDDGAAIADSNDVDMTVLFDKLGFDGGLAEELAYSCRRQSAVNDDDIDDLEQWHMSSTKNNVYGADDHHS
ncbi:hypothetical protein L7F22_030117 [Adiantum nelumboides]|nr:hypothetical protein [Adiantum nelumboides]